MSFVYAPTGGLVRPLREPESMLEGRRLPGPGVAIDVTGPRQMDELVVAAPLSGTVTEITEFSVILRPDRAAPGQTFCSGIHLLVGGVPEGTLRRMTETGHAVSAGQVLLRGPLAAEAAATVIIAVEDPAGEMLTHRMDSMIYTAEPLLEVAKEEFSLVEIDPQSRVQAAQAFLDSDSS